ADEAREALASLVDRSDECDAVDLRRVTAIGAGGGRVLVLARQSIELRIAVEERGGLVDDRRAVEELVVREPLHRAAGDVAHGVAAPAGGRDARRLDARAHRGG